MTILTSLILVLAIAIIAALISYYLQKGQSSTKEWNDVITNNFVKQQEIDEMTHDSQPPTSDKVSEPKI
tara:strand:+ start:298 stop:504 length:207 start_codon:yes stop_codon:yes gene_type:complete